jgi:ribosomal protein S18 acetylase RimI-like enzyme
VSLEHRGKGAAATLIHQIIELARNQLKVPRLLLVAHNTNLPALLFYPKLGFKPTSIGKMKNNRNETVAKIVMSLDL